MQNFSRRSFLKFGLCAAAAMALPTPSFALDKLPTKELSFYNLHTGERLSVAFRENGQYIPSALSEINHLLRDYRTSDIHAIDPKLLDQLHTIQHLMETSGEFHVISGYRSPATNHLLAERSGGVAKNSLHMQGRAIDIRLPGKDLAMLKKAAMSMKAGGVGYYPGADFVHIDTGRLRHWG